MLMLFCEQNQSDDNKGGAYNTASNLPGSKLEGIQASSENIGCCKYHQYNDSNHKANSANYLGCVHWSVLLLLLRDCKTVDFKLASVMIYDAVDFRADYTPEYSGPMEE
jgi:hypothetical protein